MFLKISQNSQENTCARVWHLWQCFLGNFVKFLRTPFLRNSSGQLLLCSANIYLTKLLIVRYIFFQLYIFFTWVITKSFANQKCWSFFSNTHSLYFRVLFFSYFNFLFAKGTSFWQKFSFMIELFLCYVDEILFFSTQNLVLNGRILQKCTFYLTCLV